MSLAWNDNQRKAAALLREGKHINAEIARIVGVSEAFVWKIGKALEAGDAPPEIPATPPVLGVANPPAGDNKT